MATKYIFFTGGVVSSVGKGVTAAAIGLLLKARATTPLTLSGANCVACAARSAAPAASPACSSARA